MAVSKRHGKRSVTIQDIAADLGLSAMTISRALRGSPDVREETRLRVEERAAELNYRLNRWARSLVTRESRIIGVVIPDISHSFFSEIIAGVQAAIEKLGYTLILCNSIGDPGRETREIDMLVSSQADGLLVASEQAEDSPEEFKALEREGVPFVLIDRYFPNFDCPRVRVDDRKVGELAASHLIELGHKRIAYIRGPGVSVSSLREEGYRRAMAAAGLAVRPEYVVRGGLRAEDGAEAARRLLSLDERPTAVFAVNDPSAMGAVQACREAGVRVPEGVSVVGAGSIEPDYFPEPFLTTAEWSRKLMGERAAEMLLELIASDGEIGEREAVLEPRLVVRRSTAPPEGKPNSERSGSNSARPG